MRRIETLTGETVAEVHHVPAQFDHERPFTPQVEALAEACGLTPEQRQTEPLLVNAPSLNFSAVVLLAGLHGSCGHFPAHERTRPVQGSVPPRYELAEVLYLQAARDGARRKR